jgi:hypothetical protein
MVGPDGQRRTDEEALKMRRRLPTAAGLTRQVAGCDDGVPGADRPGTQRLPAPMLDALSSEYPDLSGHLIVSALDAATTAAGESEQGRGRVLELARDAAGRGPRSARSPAVPYFRRHGG